jgi:hypothetical protein
MRTQRTSPLSVKDQSLRGLIESASAAVLGVTSCGRGSDSGDIVAVSKVVVQASNLSPTYHWDRAHAHPLAGGICLGRNLTCAHMCASCAHCERGTTRVKMR